ncbi:MAG: phosphonate metabolism protein/1,5-bisphosphokinase (PRPP-forming) PhnN [Panacagrimonas sp.]
MQTSAPLPSLYYVIGPSGAGKDSVLNWLRANLPADCPLLFAHRYITRAADAGGENHVALSEPEFALRRDAGLFCLHWSSHGLHYGVGMEVRHWLAAGFPVLLNGSREYLDQALRLQPSLVPVVLSVTPAVLRQRLQQRARETPQQIEQRLQRAASFAVTHPRAFELDNNASLECAGQRLLARVLSDLRAHAQG